MKKLILAFFLMGFGFVSNSDAQIIVTEFMADPAMTADNLGEWIELYNAGSSAVDINGWHLKDYGTNDHVITNGSALMIAPGSFVVLASSSDNSQNGGLTVDYAYAGFTLLNTSDAIILANTAGATVDEVYYNSNVTGKSWNLDPSQFSTTANDNLSNWCNATGIYGVGDFGTPRSGNSSCIGVGIEETTQAIPFTIAIKDGMLNIEHQKLSIEKIWVITDILGRNILSGNFLPNSPEFTVDIGTLNAGIYVFALPNSGETRKFLVR